MNTATYRMVMSVISTAGTMAAAIPTGSGPGTALVMDVSRGIPTDGIHSRMIGTGVRLAGEHRVATAARMIESEMMSTTA